MCARKNPDAVLHWAAGVRGRTRGVKLVWGAESCVYVAVEGREEPEGWRGQRGEVTGAKGRSG